MKKYALGTLLLLASYCQGIAQNFQSYIGTKDRSEVALDVKGLEDGGSVIVGYTTALKPGDKYDYRGTDMIIMRLDASGNIVWNKRYGVPDLDDKLVKVIVAQNGDFIAVGHAGMVPYMYPFTGARSSAAIFRIDPSTGNINNLNYLQSPDGYDASRGEIFRDVVEMKDGHICAVGDRDFQPSYVDGMVTMYDGNLNLQWHRNIMLWQSNELNSVVTKDDKVYVGGFYYASTYYDLHIAEFDVNGSLGWSHRYAYTANHHGTALTTNWMLDMELIDDKEIRVLTHASVGWGNPPTMSGILSVDVNNGNPFWLHMFNDPAYQFANMTSMDHESSNSAYYTWNPASIGLNQEYPNWMSGNNADALTSVIDPPAPSFADARRLLHNGTQSLNAVNLLNSDRFFAGSSIDDPQQIGAYDIYFVNSQNWLPEGSESCPTERPETWVDRLEVEHSEFEFKMDDKYEIVDVPLEEIREDYEVRMLCNHVECEIEDITFCGSQMNPGTWTFNVVTTPPGSTVMWDFGDGSPVVFSTAGIPVSHTYFSSGNYQVCVSIMLKDGTICDRECIYLCVNTRQPQETTAKKPGDAATTIQQNFVIGEIYPNPTDGTLNIPVDSKSNDKVTVRVMRMDGVVVYNKELPVSKGGDTLKLDVKSYVPGNYMIEVTNGNVKTTKMITKQ